MRAYRGIAGLIVAVAGGASAIWQVLLPWNEGTILTGADRLPGTSVDDQQPLESVRFSWR